MPQYMYSTVKLLLLMTITTTNNNITTTTREATRVGSPDPGCKPPDISPPGVVMSTKSTDVERHTATVVERNVTYKQLEMRSVERGICPIATTIMNELFQ